MEFGNNVERTLGKILATQELMLVQLEKHNKKLEEHIKEDRELAKRVDKIENKFHYLYGIAATVSTGAGLALHIILTKLGMK